MNLIVRAQLLDHLETQVVVAHRFAFSAFAIRPVTPVLDGRILATTFIPKPFAHVLAHGDPNGLGLLPDVKFARGFPDETPWMPPYSIIASS